MLGSKSEKEQLTGLVGSAVFVANGQQAVLLGLTEQLVGRRAFGAKRFGYCGNLLPPRLPPAELSRLLHEGRALVSHLSRAFNLRGLNGLDFIWRQGRVWNSGSEPVAHGLIRVGRTGLQPAAL